MQYLIIAFSLLFIFFNTIATRNFLTANQYISNFYKRFFKLLQFVKFAPVIAFLVLLVLVLTYFHSKVEIRLSHAWFDSQFWAYTTFLYCFFVITKNKLSLIFMAISLFIAIYNTPLFHYENLFIGRNVMVSDLFGILMFLSMWITISKLSTRLNP
ncbi:MAG: hypothetical protein Q8934_16975 [Bacillota bacterium]|nr:hypothetical protein [Bacillota bacterium]